MCRSTLLRPLLLLLLLLLLPLLWHHLPRSTHVLKVRGHLEGECGSRHAPARRGDSDLGDGPRPNLKFFPLPHNCMSSPRESKANAEIGLERKPARGDGIRVRW